MKVLFVCDPASTSNPYVHTLVEEMTRQGIEAWMSCDDLFLKSSYDIIHFQWPEAVYKWKRHITQGEVSWLKDRIITLKKAGKKVALTCHNLQPHTNKDEGVNKLYPVIYELSDLFIHMGKYSHELLSTKYPNAQHVIIPHHIYDGIYHFKEEKETCQKELGLNRDKVNALCFGEFRTDEERMFIIQLTERTRTENINFVTPGFYRKHWYAKSFSETCKRIRKINEYKHLGLRFTAKHLSNAITEKYFTACDIVFIQRLTILNSGNLPMGFHAGKVVVGVNSGNVGSILRETGNPTFEVNEIDSAISAIRKAIDLTREKQGEKNRFLAEREWSTEAVVKKLIATYKKF